MAQVRWQGVGQHSAGDGMGGMERGRTQCGRNGKGQERVGLEMAWERWHGAGEAVCETVGLRQCGLDGVGWERLCVTWQA